jgi:Caspase domain
MVRASRHRLFWFSRNLFSAMVCRKRARRFPLMTGLMLLVLAGSGVAANALVLRSGNGQAVHAIVIGIDAYQNVRPLKGAAADARDIQGALSRMGVADIVPLIDGEANRTNLLNAVDAMAQRISPGDLVVLSVAGHGAQEPEKVKGSQPDGMDDIFLLAGFSLTPAGSQQRIMGREFNYFIKQFEAKGARVLFVADTCHGGGLTRSVDPRDSELSFRQVPHYVLTVDELMPVGTAADALLTALDFKHTVFLAAVDRKTKSPEVRIPGIDGYRGALSYAFARALEGGSDLNHDGETTLQELFTNVKGVVYQLSDQRQNPVTVASPDQKLESEIAFRTDAAAGPLVAKTSRLQISAVDADAEPTSKQIIRVASLDPKSNPLAGLEPRETPIRIVPSISDADLIWDPKTRDALANGDVVAYQVDKGDLPSVVDRAAAVMGVKRFAAKSPQIIAVGPDDKLHHDGKKVVVDILGVAGRALVLFNLASDGTVQMLYPVRNDAPFLGGPSYRLPVVVRAPYGADQVVAVTSEQRMLALEQAIEQLNGRRTPLQAMRMIERYSPPGARIGTVGLFSAP